MMDGGREGKMDKSMDSAMNLLRAYCVPGAVLGTGDTLVSKTQTSLPS